MTMLTYYHENQTYIDAEFIQMQTKYDVWGQLNSFESTNKTRIDE